MLNKPRKLRRGEMPGGDLANRLIEGAYVGNYITVDPPLNVAMDVGGIHFWTDMTALGDSTVGSAGPSGSGDNGGPTITFHGNVTFGGGPAPTAPASPPTPPGPGPGGGPSPTTIYYGLLVYGLLDAQGGLTVTPAQPATKPVISQQNGQGPGTTTYTVGVVTTGPNGTTTGPTAKTTTGPDTISPSNPLLFGFNPTPGGGTYQLYEGLPNPGSVGTVYYNGMTNTATGTNPDGTAIQGITVGTDSSGNITVTAPITQAPNASKPAPVAPDTTATLTTTGIYTNGITAVPLPTPSAPTLTTSTAGAQTVNYQAVLATGQGTYTLPSTALAVTSVATPAALTPITVAVSLSNLPAALQQSATVMLYRVPTNNTGLPNGCIATASLAQGQSSISFTDNGQQVLLGLSTTVPASNTTGVAALTTIAGSLNVTPLTTPSAPTVVAITTGATSYSYKLVYLDSTGNTTAASAAGSISNGAASPNNAISWTNATGVYKVQIYRTVGGATQGLITTVQANAPGTTQNYTDAAATGDGTTASTTNTTGTLQVNGTNVSTGAPTWTKYTKTYIDFKTAAASNTLNLVTLSSTTVLHAVVINVPTAWTGGTISSATAQVGKTGSTGAYLTGYAAGPAGGGIKTSIDAAGGNVLPSVPNTAINVTITVAGDILNNATQGEVDVWLETSTLP